MHIWTQITSITYLIFQFTALQLPFNFKFLILVACSIWYLTLAYLHSHMNLCTQSDQKFHHFGMASLACYKQWRSTILPERQTNKSIHCVNICFILISLRACYLLSKWVIKFPYSLPILMISIMAMNEQFGYFLMRCKTINRILTRDAASMCAP